MTKAAHRESLALVVVNYGRHDLISANLEWARRRDGDGRSAEVAVVVVDNFRSEAQSQAMARLAAAAGWHLVVSRPNVGFGAAVNLGVDFAAGLGADVLIIANPDLRIGRSECNTLAAAVRRKPDTILSPIVIDGAGRRWSGVGRLEMNTGRVRSSDVGDGPRWLSGACLAVHYDAWSRIGGMDTDYFMYWEDVDLCVRAAHAGIRLELIDDVTVIHDVGATQRPTAAGKSSEHYYFNCRNRLVFAAKHLGWKRQASWVLHTPADMRRVVRRGDCTSRLVRVRYALPPAARGVAAGIWWLLRHRMRSVEAGLS